MTQVGQQDDAVIKTAPAVITIAELEAVTTKRTAPLGARPGASRPKDGLQPAAGSRAVAESRPATPTSRCSVRSVAATRSRDLDDTAIDGLSGIRGEPQRDLCYVISDDRSQFLYVHSYSI